MVSEGEINSILRIMQVFRLDRDPQGCRFYHSLTRTRRPFLRRFFFFFLYKARIGVTSRGGTVISALLDENDLRTFPVNPRVVLFVYEEDTVIEIRK